MGLLHLQVKDLNSSMLESAVTVQRLQRQRANVNATLARLQVGEGFLSCSGWATAILILITHSSAPTLNSVHGQ